MSSLDATGWGLRPRTEVPAVSAEEGVQPAPWELLYRVGTYGTFLEALLGNVRLQELHDGEHAGSRPLARLNVEAGNSWIVGLLKAWAEVGDVLTFYQERIANEGFLRTATEDLSLREIVRLIDYVRFPGAGASSHLAFQVLDVLEMPRRLRLPVGTALASVPTEAELPQEWETVQEIDARAEWNALLPELPYEVRDPVISGAATSVDLRGDLSGLEEARPLLVLAGAAREHRFLRWVEALELAEVEAPWSPAARVFWEEPLLPDAPERELRPCEVRLLENETTLFGHDAPTWEELSDEQKEEYASRLGGLIVSGIDASRGAADWSSANLGLEEEVTALATGLGGRLFAGTPSGIFERVADGSWVRSGATLVGQRIESLAAAGAGELLAGSAQSGVLRTADGEDWQPLIGESPRESIFGFAFGPRPRSGRLPESPVRDLLPSEERLFAATDHGVFSFDATKDTWRGRNRGLPDYARKTGRAGVVVRALAPGLGPGELYAGTDRGVFFSVNSGRSWRSVSRGLPGFDEKTEQAELRVLDLLHLRDSRTRTYYLFAATDRGVLRSSDCGESWQPVSLGLPGTDYDTALADCTVRALTASVDAESLSTVLYAGTAKGIFASTDLGVLWTGPDESLARRPVAALAVDGDGKLAAGVPREGFSLDDWPDFHSRSDHIDLGEVVADLERGDWIVLIEDSEDGTRRERIVRVARVEQVLRTDFALSEAITRVVPAEPVPGLETFDLRRTRVLYGSRELELFAGRVARLEPLPRERIRLLEPPLEGFEEPRRVIVEGRRLRLRLADEASPRLRPARRLHAVTSESGAREEVATDLSLLVVSPLVEAEAAAAGTRRELRVRLPGGETATLPGPPAGAAWEPATENDPLVAELATADWRTSPSGEVELALHRPLENLFDPWSVKIYGNIAEASQGRTVEDDVLGDGDSGQAFQRFPLTVPPLTYLRTPSARGYASTLEMRINGIRWREIDSLADAAPDQRSFMVRPDLEGRAAVRFGDGEHGARLPSGSENVVATYRTGLWAKALEPHSLTLLRSKPLGLDGVTNPLPVAAGAPPESPGETRERAPLSVRTFGRIVSLRDYRDFCLTYPGIAKAEVAALEGRGGTVVHLTVATVDGRPLRRGEGLHRQLLGAIEAARAEPVRTAVDSWRRVRFDVHAELRVDPDYRASQVDQECREALATRFSYAESRFGERVSAAGVVRLLQKVPGVLAVRLLRFRRYDRDPQQGEHEAEVGPYLEAAAARWSSGRGRTIGAELLELREVGGVRLSLLGAA